MYISMHIMVTHNINATTPSACSASWLLHPNNHDIYIYIYIYIYVTSVNLHYLASHYVVKLFYVARRVIPSNRTERMHRCEDNRYMIMIYK